jgi:ADP-heptose:LPS heptosyltransferase
MMPTFQSAASSSEAEIGRILREDVARICVFGQEHIGDVVNLTGPLGVIRRNCPKALIGVAVGENTVGTLTNSTDFDVLVKRFWRRTLLNKARYLSRLRRFRFDAAIILDEARSQVRYARWAGIGLTVGVALPATQRRFTFSVPFETDVHESRDQAVRLLEALGFADVASTPRLFPSAADFSKATALAGGAARPLVLIHPGAGELTRRWLPEGYAATITLLAKAGISTTLTGSPAERSLCEQIAAMTPASPPIYTDLSILEFAALASEADAVLVGDTGPMHIAAAMGTRIVALYGPAYPHRTGPYGGGHRIIQGPCSCPLRDWQTCTRACMRAIKPAEVASAVLDVVSTASLANRR